MVLDFQAVLKDPDFLPVLLLQSLLEFQWVQYYLELRTVLQDPEARVVLLDQGVLKPLQVPGVLVALLILCFLVYQEYRVLLLYQ